MDRPWWRFLKIWSTGKGIGKLLQHSCFENPMNSMKRQKDMTLKDDYLGEILIIVYISLVIIHLFRHFIYDSLQFSSVTQSCLTLCDPMNQSMSGLPVHNQLSDYSNSCPLSRWCHSTISSSVIPFFPCPQSFPVSGSFPMSQIFASVGQSIGVSASASVLPMNTQDWSPLGWTGWISLQSEGLSRILSNTTVLKHQFFSVQLSL